MGALQSSDEAVDYMESSQLQQQLLLLQQQQQQQIKRSPLSGKKVHVQYTLPCNDTHIATDETTV